ncbi:MAG: right-handed parallel beta-helix repeat-containing protein [Opitutales bacterium]
MPVVFLANGVPGKELVDPAPSRIASRALPEWIEAAVAGGRKTIRIPPGRYFVRPENGTHLRLENLSDITIEAEGVELVCTETTRAILIRNCRNLTIRGLTIDYDPLPFTQGEIVAISADRKAHTIRIQEGYPPAESAYVFKHLIYTAAGDLRYGHYYAMDIEVLPDNHLRVFNLHPDKDGGQQVGDRVAISARHLDGPYSPHSVHVIRSEATRFDGVTLYASPCFGFFETHSRGSVYQHCVIDRRDDRLLSLNADAFHSKFATRGPRIEECRAFWQGDDAVNINGAYHLVLTASDGRLRVLAKGKMDIEAGDPVQLLTAGGRALPPARVERIRSVGPATEADTARVGSLRILPGVAALLQEAFVIELDRAVDLPTGSVLGALNRMGNGFAVVGNRFGHNRSRGILVKASDGVVAGNTLVGCHLPAIKIAPEYIWLESGYSHHLRIEDNRIMDTRAESIRIANTGPHAIHSDIRITGNHIESEVTPLIRIHGLRDGYVAGNRLIGPAGADPAALLEVKDSPGLVREAGLIQGDRE